MGKILDPVNTATPQWACPYCGTDYHTDLDAATKCAHLGPATAGGAADRVAVWSHNSDGRIRRGLSIVTLEGVKLDGPKYGSWNGADEPRRHVQTYTNGMVADLGVGYTPGALIELGGERSISDDYDGDRTYGDPSRLFNKLASLDSYYQRGYTASARSMRSVSIYRERDLIPWVGPVTPLAAAAFEILAPFAWERLRDLDKRNEVIPGHRDGDRQGVWRNWVTSHSSAGFRVPAESELVSVAVAHGFGRWDTVGMSRWEFANRDAIDLNLWDRACRWVDGDPGGVIVRPTIGLSHKSAGYGGELPKAPGKKRVAALEHWGVEYYPGDDRWYGRVLDAVHHRAGRPDRLRRDRRCDRRRVHRGGLRRRGPQAP